MTRHSPRFPFISRRGSRVYVRGTDKIFVRIDNRIKLLYDNIMSNLTYNKTSAAAKPLCRIAPMPAELSVLIAAAVSHVFTVTEDPDCTTVISTDSDEVTISSPEGEITLSRPVSIMALAEAAERIASSASAYEYSADAESRSAILGDTAVTLTDTEFRLYSAILENRGGFTSREELSLAVWGRYDPNLCTVYISYLRRKLDSAFGDGTLITARGKGYRLRDTHTQK